MSCVLCHLKGSSSACGGGCPHRDEMWGLSLLTHMMTCFLSQI